MQIYDEEGRYTDEFNQLHDLLIQDIKKIIENRIVPLIADQPCGFLKLVSYEMQRIVDLELVDIKWLDCLTEKSVTNG